MAAELERFLGRFPPLNDLQALELRCGGELWQRLDRSRPAALALFNGLNQQGRGQLEPAAALQALARLDDCPAPVADLRQLLAAVVERQLTLTLTAHHCQDAAREQLARALNLNPTLTLPSHFGRPHGNFGSWVAAINALDLAVVKCEVGPIPRVWLRGDLPALEEVLRALKPWRKGHFRFLNAAGDDLIDLDRDRVSGSGQIIDLDGDRVSSDINIIDVDGDRASSNINIIDVDGEWRSEFKYARLKELIPDVHDLHILDVGCGNGYYLLRLLADGAAAAIGVDPSWHNLAQYLLLAKCFPLGRSAYLPTTLDAGQFPGFDLTLSMGVLYHRRDPLEHLRQLHRTLNFSGRLLLETLVLAGAGDEALELKGGYCGMGNVYVLPTEKRLGCWYKSCGFRLEALGPPVPTTPNEQRRTSWIDSYSLADFLRPDGLTIEGLPPPQRQMFLLRKIS